MKTVGSDLVGVSLCRLDFLQVLGTVLLYIQFQFCFIVFSFTIVTTVKSYPQKYCNSQPLFMLWWPIPVDSFFLGILKLIPVSFSIILKAENFLPTVSREENILIHAKLSMSCFYTPGPFLETGDSGVLKTEPLMWWASILSPSNTNWILPHGQALCHTPGIEQRNLNSL